MSFPKDFLFGVTTSAAQIEGAFDEDGRGLSIWDVFSRIPGKIADGTTPDVACDHYHRYKEDIQTMKELGVNSYRFSFSWSRIFPEGFGKVNEKGVSFYKNMIEELLKAGIKPNATLYHWDLPYALEQRGGWLERDCADWFAEYAQYMYREFGDLVPMWATLNEPIATYVGYALGGFAPGRISEKFGRAANHNILLAHGKAVQAFRAENLKNSEIGVVVDIWHHHPKNKNSQADIILANDKNERNYRSYLGPILKGEYSPYILDVMEKEGSLPEILPDDLKTIHQKLDYFGLNCYNRVVVSADEDTTVDTEQSGGNFLDNGTEYYPKAVYDAVNILKNDYDVQIPIYITENGTYNCNEEVVDGKVHDADRIRYIQGFLEWIEKSIEEGNDIRGYYLWSLMDNFEWSAGQTFRFGLLHTDFKTQDKFWKDSAYWYRDFIKENKHE